MTADVAEKGSVYGRLAGAVGAIAGLLALMIAAFAWPATNLGPREVPLVVAGPEQAVAPIANRLSRVAGPEDGTPAFSITRLADEAEAERALRDREAYGAIVVGQQGPQLLVASAASPALAQQLTQEVAQLGGGQQVPTRDVVPAAPDDPRGVGFGASLLPAVLISVAGGIAMWLLARRAVARIVGLFALAVVAGLGATAVLQYGFQILPGHYWLNALAVGGVVLAIASAVAGLGAVLGGPGIALAALTIVFIGNPWSGATAAPELLPQPWGEIGQFLPPGAGASLLRSVAFFDGAAAAGPAWVLAVWAGAGLILVGAGAVVRRTSHAVAPERDVAVAHFG